MKNKRSLKFFGVFLGVIAVVFFLAPLHAFSAEFSADLLITAPDGNYTFKLYVKDNMYRLEKVKGGMKFPPFPTIVNRNTGITWGLNPQARQYVEMKDSRKTMMMNPIPGWEMMRKDYKKKASGSKTVNGYVCDKFVYHKPGKSKIEAAVWISKKLNHFIKQVHYATNGNAVMELKNISEGSVNDGLFKIPAGYSKMSAGGPSAPAGAASAPQPAKQARVTAPGGTSAGNVMFILDASGSMWGRVEGKAKIAIAKEVLGGLIKDLPDDLHVGLVAYGHRRKGDCNDVEELVPLGPLDKKKLIKKIQAISPKGKTPITLSVRKTAQKLKGLKDETTIILVSDGKETCEGDPCALVKELKAAGIKFTMHVIGFDVTEEERVQLECMAKAGDGEYFTAKTAKDFRMAATKMVKKAQEFGVLEMVAMKNGRPLHAWVEIKESGTKKIVRKDTTSGETGTRTIKLPPGRYDILVQDSESVSGGEVPPVRFSGVSIELGKTVKKRADFSDGILVIKTIKNEKPVEAKVHYYRSGEKNSFFNESTHPKTGKAKRRFIPGTYDIKVVDFHTAGKPSITVTGIEVPPGKTVEKVVTFASGNLKILSTRNGKPFSCAVKIFNPEGKIVSNFWTQQGQRIVQLLQGTYDVEMKLMDIPGGNPVIRLRGVVIEAYRTEEITANFEIGFLTVSATLNGKPFVTPVKLYKEGSKSNIGHWTTEGSRTFPLVPGVYNAKVVSIKDNKQFKTFEGMQIEGGKTESITVAFPVPHQETKTAPKRKVKAARAPAPAKTAKKMSVKPLTKPSPTQGEVQEKQTIMGGEFPLYKGATVISYVTKGGNTKVEMEVKASADDVVGFYKQTLTKKGWQSGMVMVRGNRGAAMFNKGSRKLILSIKQGGEKTIVSLVITGG